MAGSPDVLAVLKLHYLRWNLFEIKGDTYFQYMGIFDTDFDKYTEDAVAIFSATGLSTSSRISRGFQKDWKTNPAAFVKFVREHHQPAFLEYGEYPYVSRRRDQEGAQAEGGLLDDARSDAVTRVNLAMTTKIRTSAARRFFAGASLILFAGSKSKGATR